MKYATLSQMQGEGIVQGMEFGALGITRPAHAEEGSEYERLEGETTEGETVGGWAIKYLGAGGVEAGFIDWDYINETDAAELGLVN